jgi:hypothetical protein
MRLIWKFCNTVPQLYRKIAVVLWEQPYEFQSDTFSKKQQKISLYKVVKTKLSLNGGPTLDIMTTR